MQTEIKIEVNISTKPIIVPVAKQADSDFKFEKSEDLNELTKEVVVKLKRGRKLTEEEKYKQESQAKIQVLRKTLKE